MLVIMYGSINQSKISLGYWRFRVGLMAWFIVLLSCCKTSFIVLRDLKAKRKKKDPV
jgi:hypothetical protein